MTSEDRGSYLILYRLPRKRHIEIGGLGKVTFKQGYYIYVGSAMKNLSQRVERHRRIIKKPHWHIDYFSGFAEFQASLPVRSEDDLECELALAISSISERSVPGFGSSDCSCPSHLFGFSSDPMSTREFHEVLQYFRMDRLLEKYSINLDSTLTLAIVAYLLCEMLKNLVFFLWLTSFFGEEGKNG